MSLPSIKLTDPRALRGYAHPLRMALVGLLRQAGPLTATRAADLLGESVPSCSFHLRQLAKYGLAERVPGADGRQRPWRATAMLTSWDDGADDPALRAATDQLNAAVLDRYVERTRAALARRADEPVQWREVTGLGDWLVYLTPAELGELNAKVDALIAEYDERTIDPAKRPEGARPIGIIRIALPSP